MEPPHHGIDQSVIALWLGRESVETRQIYVHADLRLKEQVLAPITDRASNPGDFARMTTCSPSWRASDYAAPAWGTAMIAGRRASLMSEPAAGPPDFYLVSATGGSFAGSTPASAKSWSASSR
jgi:hypothetical protein